MVGMPRIIVGQRVDGREAGPERLQLGGEIDFHGLQFVAVARL